MNIFLIKPLYLTDYIFVFVLSLVSFLIGYLFAKKHYKKGSYSMESSSNSTEDLVDENGYVASNFGKPGVIKAIKTYERGKYVRTTEDFDETTAKQDKQEVVTETVNKKDDLKKLKGIGPSVEKKFNEIGFYTFDQLTGLPKEDPTTISKVVSFLPKQIKIEDICNQAKLFTSSRVSA